MKPTVFDIRIDQGADWLEMSSFTWYDETGAPVDLTNFEISMQVRAKLGAKKPILEICAQPITDGFDVSLSFTAEQTAAIKTTPSELVWVDERQAQPMYYDIKLKQPNGKVFTLLQGFAYVFPGATEC